MDTIYSMEWSPGVEYWSGVNFGVIKLSCFATHSDKARPYSRKYQQHKLPFYRCGCEFLSDLIDLYFWGNHNDTKLKRGTGGYHEKWFCLKLHDQ